MGEIADMIIDGILDEETGEYIGEGVGYPRTFQKLKESASEKKIRKIRKEIAIDINKNSLSLEDARKKANQKYGKGWRKGIFKYTSS